MSELFVDVPYDCQELPGHNGVRLTVDSLSPDAAFQVQFTPDSSVPVETHEMTRTTYILAPSTDQDYLYSPLQQYLEEHFLIAHLTATISCDNCEGTKESPILVSALRKWEYQILDIQESKPDFKWKMILHATYDMPHGSDHITTTSPLHLQLISHEGSDQPSVEVLQTTT